MTSSSHRDACSQTTARPSTLRPGMRSCIAKASAVLGPRATTRCSDTSAPRLQPAIVGPRARLGAKGDGVPQDATPETGPDPEVVPASAPEGPPSGSSGSSDEGAARSGHALRGRRGAWAGAALLCVVAGLAGSVLGARAVAHKDAEKARQAFPHTAADIGSGLALNIQHEEDLVIAASTFFAGDPQATAPRFSAWVHWARTLRRYPELQRLGFVTLVRSSELPAFEALVLRPPASAGQALGRSPRSNALRIAPAGARPYYCLATVELTRGSVRSAPAARPLRAHAGPARVSRQRPHRVRGQRRRPERRPGSLRTGLSRQPAAERASTRGARRSRAGCARCGAPAVVLDQALAGNPQYALHLRHSERRFERRVHERHARTRGAEQHEQPARWMDGSDLRARRRPAQTCCRTRARSSC